MIVLMDRVLGQEPWLSHPARGTRFPQPGRYTVELTYGASLYSVMTVQAQEYRQYCKGKVALSVTALAARGLGGERGILAITKDCVCLKVMSCVNGGN